MRIAQIAPLAERVPPKKYGGTERVVFDLTEELVRRGHDVTLFASGDSETSAKLSSVTPRGLRETRSQDIYGPNVLSMLNIGVAYSQANNFDIIHDHNGHLSLPTAQLSPTPVVSTMHGIFTTANKKMFSALKKPNIVTISNSQTLSAPDINHAGTVYNGLNMDHFPFSEETDRYLLFVGRISPEKGVHLAIEAAQELDLPLIIIAKLESVDMEYFNKYVGPKLSDEIRWVGEMDETERNRYYSRAICLVNPLTWKEPFGLTMIEAMACGCPVVSFGNGSVPEIVLDGKTGYVVADTEEMIDRINHIDKIKRSFCRKHVLKNFNEKNMAEGYEKIYQSLLKEKQQHNGIKRNSIAKQIFPLS